MFQFHKVQLKADRPLFETILFWFQFHKVQLKVPEVREGVIPLAFQFHKVQLKDRNLDIIRLWEIRFNSIRYN